MESGFFPAEKEQKKEINPLDKMIVFWYNMGRKILLRPCAPVDKKEVLPKASKKS